MHKITQILTIIVFKNFLFPSSGIFFFCVKWTMDTKWIWYFLFIIHDKMSYLKIDLYTLIHSIEMCASFSFDEPHGTKYRPKCYSFFICKFSCNRYSNRIFDWDGIAFKHPGCQSVFVNWRINWIWMGWDDAAACVRYFLNAIHLIVMSIKS